MPTEQEIEKEYKLCLANPTLYKAFMQKLLPKCKAIAIQQALRDCLDTQSWRTRVTLTESEICAVLTCVIDIDNIDTLKSKAENDASVREAQMDKFLTYTSLERFVFPEACFLIAQQLDPQNAVSREAFYNLPV